MMCLVALAACWAALPGPAWADGAATREYQVKAAFLTKFIQFVKWPAAALGASDPVVILVIDDASGRDPFEGTLDRLIDGKAVNGRTVQVRHCAPSANLAKCHVLFIPASQDGNLSSLLDSVRGRSALTIGESDKVSWAGGVVRFYLDDNKVRFEISPEAAKAANLEISTKLLSLARIFQK